MWNARAKPLFNFVDLPWQTESTFHGLMPRVGESLAQPSLDVEAMYALRQGSRVPRFKTQTVLAVFQVLGGSTHRGRYHRKASRHCLEHHERKGLELGRAE